jgi:hypothetical protein
MSPNRPFLFYPCFLVLLLSLSWSCSDEDPEVESPIPEVRLSTFLSADLEEIQMDVTNDGTDPIILYLNDELGLDFLQFGRRDVDESSVGYYFWQEKLSRAYFKDLDSGTSFSLNDVCGFASEGGTPRVIRSVLGNRDYVVMPYTREGDGMALEFALRIFDRATSQCRDVSFPQIPPSGIENLSLEGNWLGLYYLDAGTGNPLLDLVDLAQGQVRETINLNLDFQAATFRGDEVWIFNKDTSYQVFNASSGTFIRSGNAPGLPAQGPGMFDSRFSGNQLLVRYIYQQPSLFFAQPAVYDFDRSALVEGSEPYLPLLQERIEQQTGDRVLFGNYGVDLPTGIIALSYVRGNGTAEGGVVLTNFGQDWFELLELPFLPEEIEIRDVR